MTKDTQDPSQLALNLAELPQNEADWRAFLAARGAEPGSGVLL